MNAISKIEPDARLTALAKLREPFATNHISKLPKPTKAQTDAVKADFKKGVRCKECGAWHHPDVVHLDYVGHAALTDRLLDVDPEWTWEPVAFAADGQPARDATGGLWIKLTVAGVTRFGYGSADGKSGGDAVKELIGDALRNAGMRFGAALDLWHKGDLHAEPEEPEVATKRPSDARITDDQRSVLLTLSSEAGTDMQKFCAHFGIASLPYLPAEQYETARQMLAKKLKTKGAGGKPADPPPASDILEDEIPY